MTLEPIPFIDIRGESPVKIIETYPERCRTLLHASRNAFGPASRLLSSIALPIGDAISKKWLEKSDNPYRHEIEAYDRIAKIEGLQALNLCYEWGCTSGAYDKDGSVTLSRVLDWPFPALGETMVVAQQSGVAGDFYNVTWPGMCGIYNAMAPGRFAAAINQAPMRRYRLDIVTDWLRNRVKAYRSNALPPSHLLRKAFENAVSYEEARHMLASEPVALPVIYILSGTKPGEGCVIERLENEAAIREISDGGSVCAANHFESWFNGIGSGWLPRALESNNRVRYGRGLDRQLLDETFSWFQSPVANKLSRLALVADAGRGTLSVMGTDGVRPVTQAFRL